MKNDLIELPEYNYLTECFRYDEEKGELYWKERPKEHFKTEMYCKIWNKRFANKLTGCVVGKYKRVTLDGYPHILHRLIWKLYYRENPKHFIDHINGNKLDNKIENLRDVDPATNSRNITKLNKNNNSGYTGVYYCKMTNSLVAQIQVLEKLIRLGSYNSKEEAAIARELKAKEIYGDDVYNSSGGDRLSKILDELDFTKKPKIKNRINNTSGERHIFINKNNGKYIVKIERNRHVFRLGTYTTIDEAIIVRDKFLNK